ncbi:MULTISPECIES: hypothetical protein [Citricoccus]|uniref:Uncharacterized protein n=1 Tax=Citricoccus muralis TaxID=169134 RepID=A0ABY8H958_9MICC|nr:MULTISPECIES: hypothetical protein [Citricoccus]WBL19245.1 hypothetical protein O1A05_00610 [Citricoccus sp. NR2]WFP17147.1 hypothetical protein P8192_03200 [Citricoccus muralis]
MPSYRTVLQIGDLRPGHTPPQVMTTARASLAALFTVESTDIEVVARVPQIVLRFTVEATSDAEEQQLAVLAVRRMRAAVSEVAATGTAELFLRRGGRWVRTLSE